MKTKLLVDIQEPDVAERVAGRFETMEVDAIDAALAVRITAMVLSGATVRIEPVTYAEREVSNAQLLTASNSDH